MLSRDLHRCCWRSQGDRNRSSLRWFRAGTSSTRCFVAGLLALLGGGLDRVGSPGLVHQGGQRWRQVRVHQGSAQSSFLPSFAGRPHQRSLNEWVKGF
jgi:hypothetical protein